MSARFDELGRMIPQGCYFRISRNGLSRLCPFVITLLMVVTANLAATSTGENKNDFLIVPGERVGPISQRSSEADLIKVFGKSDVHNKDVPVGEGETEPGTVVFLNDPARTFEILWKDQQKKRFPDQIRFSGGKKTRWRTSHGVAIGTTLKELEALNGKPFTLAGFAWDYSGTVCSWKGGKLEKEFGSENSLKLTIRLGPTGERGSENDILSVAGEHCFESDNKIMRKINPSVYEIIFNFK